MIDWIKYDPKNPPELGKRFLINLHGDLDFTFTATYKEWGWKPSNGMNVQLQYNQVWYAEINLPMEG